MAITIECPCGKKLKTADENAGKRAKCPACGSVLPIPEPGYEEPEYGLVPDPEPGPESRPLRMRFGPGAPAPEETEPTPAPGPGRYPEPEPVFHATSPRRERGPARFDPEMDDQGSSPREYLYLALLLALIPLAISLMSNRDDLKERLARTLDVPIETVEQRLVHTSKAELLQGLPDNRIEGALVGHGSMIHWLFAGMSATAFLGLMLLMFPKGDTKPHHLIAVGLFTATLGILFLLAVQFAAALSGGVRVFRGKGAILWLILMFIGFSYQAANDPENGFLLSAFGFTCGVGLCEELCKALPILYMYSYTTTGAETWRKACLWGLASGVGFGVSEGIMYSADHYNGLATGLTYLVRFVSCVSLHAVWGASVGLATHKRKESVQGAVEGFEYILAVLRIIAVPMVLHGLYDTMLKKDMNFPALGIACLSFAWFAWLVESSRGAEDAAELRGNAWA